MGFHFYVDDTQLYLSFNSLSANDQVSSVSQVKFCVREIDNWMTRKKLKLNRDKTESLVISPRYLPRPSLDSIEVGNYLVCPSVSARNIGIVFDQTLSLEKHANSVCKAALFHLRNIAKIREYLTVDNTNLLVRYEPSRNLRSTDKYLLRIPQTCLKTYGDRALSVAAPGL